MSGVRCLVTLSFLLISMLIGCNLDLTDREKEPLAGPGGVMLGMTRQEVIQTMLEVVQLLQMSGKVTNPYATRFVRDIEGDPLEVMYYYTGMKKGDDLVSDDELVPILLKDDAVINWGWDALEEMTGSRPGP